MSNITTITRNGLAPLPARFAGLQQDKSATNELGAGIAAGFAIVSIRGKEWRVKHSGQETVILNSEGEAARSIEAVIVRAADHLAKIFYENGYQEGSNAAPDCFSTSGIAPDPASPKRQATACATCPKNAWGSRVNAATGKDGKACADSKRLAIVPLRDLRNEVYGGPMLLRVPAASLKDMQKFGSQLAALGYPVCAVAVKLAFSGDAYPRLTFQAVRTLTEEEAEIVLELRESEQVRQILDEAVEITEEPVTAEQVFLQPPVQPISQKVAAAAQARQPVAPQPAPAPAPVAPVTPSVTPPAPAPAPAAPAPQAAPEPAPAPAVGGFGATAPVVEDAQFVEDAVATAATGVDDFDAMVAGLMNDQ